MSVLALVLLIANDHWLKRTGPEWLAGKLSDFAGLLFLPLLLIGLSELVRSSLGRPWCTRPRTFIGTALAVGVIFALMKTTSIGADSYRAALGWAQWLLSAPVRAIRGRPIGSPGRVGLVEDWTDLVAVPALLGSVWIGLRASERGSAQCEE